MAPKNAGSNPAAHLKALCNAWRFLYVLKAIVMYVLPPLATLYFALSGIWGLPYGEQVVGTITAVTTCLSVMLGISSQQYKAGTGDIAEFTDTTQD